MDEINFTKLTGAGNDFILIDKNINQNVTINSELISKMCDRRFGVGADGILVIDDADNFDFLMEYFNSDGSSGMLCGNGARCIIKYAHQSGRIKGKETNFLFNNEIFSGKVLENDLIEFSLNPPSKIKENFIIEVFGKKLLTSFIDTGAHHVVIDINEDQNAISMIEDFPVIRYGREIRFNELFDPPGTNVNFISIINNMINIRTYERGVEDETLACGTGSVASAIISFLANKISPPISVKTKSGKILIVNFEYYNGIFSNITLTGEAEVVFKGKYKI